MIAGVFRAYWPMLVRLATMAACILATALGLQLMYGSLMSGDSGNRSPDPPATCNGSASCGRTSAGAQLPAPQQRLVDLVDQLRKSAGCPQLRVDPHLVGMARAHASDMTRRAFVGHINPDNSDEIARARASGYGGSVVENIAVGLVDPDDVFREWTNPRNPQAGLTKQRLLDCTRVAGGVGFNPGSVLRTMGSGSWVLDLGDR